MTYSKSALAEQAKELFEKFGVKKLYATSDGQFFEEQNRAALHAANKCAVYEINEGEQFEPAEEVNEGNEVNEVKAAEMPTATDTSPVLTEKSPELRGGKKTTKK